MALPHGITVALVVTLALVLILSTHASCSFDFTTIFFKTRIESITVNHLKNCRTKCFTIQMIITLKVLMLIKVIMT